MNHACLFIVHFQFKVLCHPAVAFFVNNHSRSYDILRKIHDLSLLEISVSFDFFEINKQRY